MLKNILFILAFLGNGMSSQGANIDSLRIEFQKEKSPEAKFNLAHQLSLKYLAINVDSNLHYLKQMDSLREEIGSDSIHLVYLINIARRNSQTNQIDSCIEQSSRALKLAEKLALDFYIASALITRSGALYFKTDFNQAIPGYQKAAKSALAANDSNAYISSVLGEAICMIALGQNKESIPILLKVVDSAEKIGSHANESLALHYIGYLYYNLSEFDQARIYFERAFQIRQENGNLKGASYSILGIANIDEMAGNYQSAIEKYAIAIENLRSIGDNYALASAYEAVANLNIELSQYELAQNYLDSSFAISILYGLKAQEASSSRIQMILHYQKKEYQKLIGVGEKLIKMGKEQQNANTLNIAYSYMAMAYEELSDFKTALEYQKRLKTHDDSVNVAATSAQVQELESKYNSEAKEREIYSQQAKIAEQELALQKSENRNLITLFGIILLGVVGVGVSIALIQNKRAKSKLYASHQALLLSNEKLQELNLEKNNLIGIVAHDLKSPFHNIIGLTEVFKLKSELSPEQEKIVNMIKSSADNVSGMIDHILDLNKIESNLLNMELSPVNVSGIAQLIVDRFQYTLSNKEIRIVSDINPSVYALANENYFNQVAENILSNAIKFSDKNSEIKINLTAKENYALLEIIDEGPGITEEFKDKIFEQNVVGNAKPTDGEHSSGIGLAIVKKFVDSMGGDVWFEPNPVKGTSFFVKLRLAS